MKLISMTDFVLDINTKIEADEIFELFGTDLIFNYAKFLKQSLKLEMFVNSDDEYVQIIGNPKKFTQNTILFENIRIARASKHILNIYINENIAVVYDEDYGEFRASKTIDDLANLRNDIILTENALKQIGL